MSETTNLKLKKHDNVTTNTSQFDIQNYMNGNWDKVDSFAGQVNENIEDIESKQAEQDIVIQKNTTDILNLDTSKASKAELQEATIALQAELKATRKDLQAGTLEGQDTGESLYLQDSSNARFREFEISGNSKQEKREGYNKLKYPYSDPTKTIYGITFTVNNDGSLKIEGTATGTAYFDLYYNISEMLVNDTNKAYTFTLAGSNNLVRHYYERIDGNWVNKKSSSTDTSFTPTSEATGQIFRVLVNSGKTVNETIYPMVYEGTENKPYEQYGAMPSLEFPSEIQAVGQDVNLFDKDNAVILSGYLGDDGQIKANSLYKTAIFKCNSELEYTISKVQSKIFRVAEFENAPQIGDTWNNRKVADASTTINYTTSANGNYMAITYKRDADTLTEQEILDSIKIVEGTEINGYSPYNCGSANVVIENKNELDFSKWNNVVAAHGTIEQVENGIKLTATEDDCYTNTFAYKYQGTLNKERIEKYGIIAKPNNKYTFSCKVNDANVSKRLYMFFADKDYNNIGSISSATSVLTATAPADCKYITFRVGVVYNGNSLTFTDLQVEEGETATDYAAHEEQTFTMPVQQEMLEGDNFEKVDGVWKEKHNWRKIILNGTESCKATTDVSDRFLFDRLHNFTPLNHTRQKCTHSAENKAWGIPKNSFDVRDNGGAYINIPNTTVEELKAKLAEDYANGTPLTFCFEVEPYYLACTEAQIEALDEIEKILHTYKNGTHVYCTDEISAIFNVRYTRDQEAYIKNEINKMQAMILAE